MALPESIDFRNLFLYGEITHDNIQPVLENIILFNEIDDAASLKKPKPRQPIKLYIDTLGGDFYQCMSLVSIMLTTQTPIHTYILGTAMSAGFVIAVCGDRRYCHEHSLFMYHQMSDLFEGNLKQMKDTVNLSNKLQKQADALVISKTNISKQQLTRKQDTDWYLDSQTALKFGVVDEIVKRIV